jgi:hypothetical protein
MTILRIRFRQLGAHVHCRVFVGASYDGTFEKAGEFVLGSGEQWLDFVAMMSDLSNVQIKHEDEA